MATTVSDQPQSANPSPVKAQNPFARPRNAESSSLSTFSRVSLLPQHSPIREPAPPGGVSSTPVSERRPARPAWRMLWRGGLEVGPDGWRLDGVTFIALLSFPSGGTPSSSGPAVNPFAVCTPGKDSASSLVAPSADTDLCLSLESMRGRKYLQVRDVIPLGDHDLVETEDGGVQMSITSPLLAAFFTGLLCRSPTLSTLGRTTSGVVIGLGDEGIDGANAMVIVYGQQHMEAATPTLRLCVGRRRVAAPPSAKKVRPGEPLPRAPLFFPDKSRGLPLLYPRRDMARAPSVSSIYDPPPSAVPAVPAPVSGRTPGRRGEKRPRRAELSSEDDRRRKAGKVVPERSVKSEEDIFGIQGSSRTPSVAPPALAVEEHQTSSTSKRPRVPQQTLDNKALIRKQTLVALEARGYARDNELFKDLFGTTTKGTYFAFRYDMETAPLAKQAVQAIIAGHLDMYLPAPPAADDEPQEEEARGKGGGDVKHVRTPPSSDEARPVASPVVKPQP